MSSLLRATSLWDSREPKKLYRNERTGQIGTTEEILRNSRYDDIITIYNEKQTSSSMGQDSLMDYSCSEFMNQK